MGSAKVTTREKDLTTRVPSFPGVRGAIAFPAVRGSVTEPILVTSESDVLDLLTPNGRVEVGWDTGYFSLLTFLKKSDKCYVQRVAKNAFYGGAVIMSTGTTLTTTDSFSGTSTSATLSETTLYNKLFNGSAVLYSTSGTASTGLTNNTTYYVRKGVSPIVTLHNTQADAIANTNPITIGTGAVGTQNLGFTEQVLNSPFSPRTTNSVFTVNTGNSVILSNLYNKLQNGYAVTYTVSGGTAPSGLSNNGIYYVKKNGSLTISIYPTKSDALANTNNITIGALGTGTHTLEYTEIAGKIDPTSYEFGSNECMIIYGSDPGVWNNNDISIKITDYSHKEPDSFRIQVFRPNNPNVPIDGEDFICSRKHKLDGDGRNIFIEDRLKSSKYIRALTNPLISDTVMPTFSTSTVPFAGGTNGDPITDSDMINALNNFSNKDSILITVVMDAGWSTPNYASAIAQLCYNRGDCVGCLSYPISAEMSSNYMFELQTYRLSLASLITDEQSSFVALYSSHQKILDKFNNRSIYVSPDGFAGGAISYSASNYEIWYPPAGWKRGGISVEEPLLKFSQGQMDVLYDNNINPIRFKTLKGVAIWGQKTLLNRPSALDRLNVRLLLIILRPAISEVLENYVFDLADIGDRREIVSIIKDYMKGIKSRKGVYDSQVIADSRNNSNDDIDNHRLRVWILVKPTISQEEITIDFVITKTGDNFNTIVNILAGGQ